MNTIPTILRPEITVTIRGHQIVVRDLPWQDSLQFLKMLSAQAQGLLASVMVTDATGKVSVNIEALLPKLTELIGGAEDLTTFLLTKSIEPNVVPTGLGTLETLALIDAALEVNLSDGLIALGKKVGGRLGRVLAAKTNTTPQSAIS